MSAFGAPSSESSSLHLSLNAILEVVKFVIKLNEPQWYYSGHKTMSSCESTSFPISVHPYIASVLSCEDRSHKIDLFNLVHQL